MLFARLEVRAEEEVEPEDHAAILPAYQAAFAEVIRAAGGHTAQPRDEDQLAFFGYPRASEDAPLRAVRAGLALVEAVATPAPPRRGSASACASASTRVGRHQ